MKTKFIYIAVFLQTLTVNSQSLNDYLTIASENNPELQAMQYRYESALEKINEVGSLPNTTISIGYFIQPVETRVGAQKAKISASQMLPWFGALGVKKESATYMASAELNNFDFAKRRLFLDLKTAYYELYELIESAKIIRESITIFNTFENLALTELENNRSTMVDVLKIRMEKNELENQLNSIQQNLNAKQIAFNLLLNREAISKMTIVEEIIIDTSEVFNQQLISNNPKILQLDNLKNASEKAEKAVNKDGLPSFGIGLDYGFIQARNVENLTDNGKDIIMPMATVSFPLFSKKYSSKQKQLQLDQKAIESRKLTTHNRLNSLFESANGNYKNAINSIETQKENINDAKSAKKVLLSAYETSKVDFEQLLEIQQLLLKFQLKKVVSEKQYGIQKSTLEFLTKEN